MSEAKVPKKSRGRHRSNKRSLLFYIAVASAVIAVAVIVGIIVIVAGI